MCRPFRWSLMIPSALCLLRHFRAGRYYHGLTAATAIVAQPAPGIGSLRAQSLSGRLQKPNLQGAQRPLGASNSHLHACVCAPCVRATVAEFVLALKGKVDNMGVRAAESGLVERRPSGNLSATASSWLPPIVFGSASSSFSRIPRWTVTIVTVVPKPDVKPAAPRTSTSGIASPKLWLYGGRHHKIGQSRVRVGPKFANQTDGTLRQGAFPMTWPPDS
jgi:hypothetical protein